MRTQIKKATRSVRIRPIFLLALILLIVSFLTRLVLSYHSFEEVDWSVPTMLNIFGIGLFYDLVNAVYFLAIPTLLLWSIPKRYLSKNTFRYVVTILFFLLTFVLLFTAVAEYFFWDEFNARFNFIAVDYLVYTTEVIGNIRESYPIEWIILILLLATGGITFICKPVTVPATQASNENNSRIKGIAFIAVLPLLIFISLDSQLHYFSENNFSNELAGNGMYELFSAYRNNELNYEQFYPHLSDKEALEIVNHALLSTQTSKDPYSIEHHISSNDSEKRLNVILISVESLSAEFMNLFGSTRNITPNLDSLAKHSLVFTNLYATGTRTVRGLEALSLSIPPTPGQSIVRRPNNEHLFSLATVFNQKGYESKFIYGGYGYFDNMNYFFENNGYTVIDRTALSSSEIDYENIWGVADENLFTLALREIDKTVQAKRPVFAHIMTTSNHRPYTYPEGRIDIPSHTSRAGAVKYTDYAIGKFLQEASSKEWYDNTLFVITADHCASSAGKTALPIEKYKIPLLIFSSQMVTNKTENRLMSQIDIAPTLLGLLDFNYDSKFFGYDIFMLPLGEERAFLSTYQTLGFLKNDSLVILSPKKEPVVIAVANHTTTQPSILTKNMTSRIAKEAISWYQSASYEFRHNKLKQAE